VPKDRDPYSWIGLNCHPELTTEVRAYQAGHMAKKVAKRALPFRAIKKKTPKKAKAVAKRTPKKAAKAQAGKPKIKPKTAELDLNAFPPESLVESTLGLCLACALNLLTRQLALTRERARLEIRRYNPTLEELTTSSLSRPYLVWPANECPYCHAPPKWLAPLRIVKIEGGKTTDAPRRALLRTIGDSPNFTIIEEKSTERDALYSWLSKTGSSLDLESPAWLIEAARHWLGRRLPNENWPEILDHISIVRRSRRLEEGIEKEGTRLFLAPALFDEILLIQYLLSRSHKAGGQTFEGRLTLQDLFHRLRRGGYLNRMGISTSNPADALEQLVEVLGGEGRVKFYYIVDRRELTARLASLKDARIPRPNPKPL
jgi:hypothetical protein